MDNFAEGRGGSTMPTSAGSSSPAISDSTSAARSNVARVQVLAGDSDDAGSRRSGSTCTRYLPRGVWSCLSCGFPVGRAGILTGRSPPGLGPSCSRWDSDQGHLDDDETRFLLRNSITIRTCGDQGPDKPGDRGRHLGALRADLDRRTRPHIDEDRHRRRMRAAASSSATRSRPGCSPAASNRSAPGHTR